MILTLRHRKRIYDFRDRLNITEDSLITLNAYKDYFISRKGEFAQIFYEYFLNVQEAKPILELVTIPDILYKTWASWFESIFRDTIDNEYLESLWTIGEKHVERNIEPRLMILGFSIIRQYVHEIVRTRISSDKSIEIVETINKLLDLYLYVMTAPYIETTTRFDIELLRGIADKIRNPVTIIGGNIHRLKRKASQNSDHESYAYDTILEENKKIEQIIKDAEKYLELFDEDPQFKIVPIVDLMNTILEKLLLETSIENLKIDIQADSSLPYVKGDPKHIELIFHSVLKNSLEASNSANPQITIKTTLDKETYHYLQIEIFNTGIPPKEEYMEKVFAPFFSTKKTGTGFGLPIAQLALRKNYGQIHIKPIPQQGTSVIINLPLPDFCDYQFGLIKKAIGCECLNDQ